TSHHTSLSSGLIWASRSGNSSSSISGRSAMTRLPYALAIGAALNAGDRLAAPLRDRVLTVDTDLPALTRVTHPGLDSRLPLSFFAFLSQFKCTLIHCDGPPLLPWRRPECRGCCRSAHGRDAPVRRLHDPPTLRRPGPSAGYPQTRFRRA